MCYSELPFSSPAVVVAIASTYSPTHGGTARLSWPGWLYQDGANAARTRERVTHPSTNRRRRLVTTLTKTNALPLCQTTLSTVYTHTSVALAATDVFVFVTVKTP